MSGSSRSPEERERARLEREARRAARHGEPAPPPLEPPSTPIERAPDEPSRPSVEPPRNDPPPNDAEPEAVDSEPEPRSDPEVVEEPQADPRVADEPVAVQPPVPPEPFDPSARRPQPRIPERGRRTAAERRAAAARYLDVRDRAGGPGAGDGRGGSGARSGPRRGRLALVAGIGGLAAVALAWFLMSLFQPLKGDGVGEVVVTVPEGAGVGEIADMLEREGVISSATFFRLRTTLAGKSGDFKAGEVPLREDMSYAAAIDALISPPPPNTITITIPEGLSRREAAGLIGDSLRGDYLRATRGTQRVRPARYGAQRARDLEGFLFPATYELEPGDSVRALVDRQLEAFQREIAGVDLRHARSKNLTVYDVLIIASMIDREAQLPRERRLVSSVIYNRLQQRIPLGIDATIRFATRNWSEPLKESELAIDSGYNTRLHQGLPPGPIGSPGIAAIRAAANPARTDYIYYVVEPCGNGAHAFSATDAEFQRDVARYNAERERQGGRSPVDC